MPSPTFALPFTKLSTRAKYLSWQVFFNINPSLLALNSVHLVDIFKAILFYIPPYLTVFSYIYSKKLGAKNARKFSSLLQHRLNISIPVNFPNRCNTKRFSIESFDLNDKDRHRFDFLARLSHRYLIYNIDTRIDKIAIISNLEY